MKKFVTFVLILGLGMFTLGCGGSGASPTRPNQSPGKKARDEAAKPGADKAPGGDKAPEKK